jgi:hypothetical protein
MFSLAISSMPLVFSGLLAERDEETKKIPRDWNDVPTISPPLAI